MSHLDPERLEQLASQPDAPEPHLAQCEACRDAVRAARARQTLLRGLRPYTLSDAAFRRVEARLDEAVREGLPSPAPWWRWWGLGAAVAAAGVAFFVVTAAPAPGVVELPAKQVALARAEFRPLTVISGAAQARADAASTWRALAPGDVLNAGEAISGAALTLSDARAEWALVSSGASSLGGPAALTLGAGEVVARVKAEGALSVLASTRLASASDALFSVTRVGAEVVLTVAEGQVDVIDSLSAERRTFRAPVAVRWADGSALREGREEPPAPLSAPVVPAPPWSRFDGTQLAQGTRVSVDGALLGVAPFTALVATGRRQVSTTPPGAQAIDAWVDFTGGPFVAKVELPEKKDVSVAEPSAEALVRVRGELRAQTPRLAACYEKWLKANPTAEGEVMLSLVVSAQGRVRRATLGPNAMSAASAECLTSTARALVLSPLGAEATLEVPLVLRVPRR